MNNFPRPIPKATPGDEPQALNVGRVWVVSTCVGGKEFVRHRDSGSFFTPRDAQARHAEIRNRRRPVGILTRTIAARAVIPKSKAARSR